MPTTGTAPTSTTAPGSGPCSTTALRVTLESEQGAAGTGIYEFLAVNAGSATCQAGGYFGVSIYDQAGQLFTATDSRSPTTYTGAGVQHITLSPEDAMTFQVGIGETPTGGATTCPLIGAFHLIPPNDTGFVQVSEPASAGYSYCGPDGLEVNPNQPA